VIDPARSSWRCLKGHTDGPKASWSRVCVSCLYLALRPCIVRRVSRARGRGVPWRSEEENSKHGGGARDGGRGPGEARAVFTFVSVRNLDILYIIPPRNRGSRARSSKHPLRALPQLSASTAHRRDPGVPGVRGEWPRRELTRTSAGLKMCRERKEARTCVCVVRVWTVCAVARTTLHSRLSRVSLSLSVSRRA